MRRQELDDNTFEMIDWDSLEKASRNWYFGKLRWISKAMAGISPTGRQMLRRKEWDHDQCLRCDAEDEDTWHVLTCQASTTRQCWTEQIQQLKADLTELRTDPLIILAMT